MPPELLDHIVLDTMDDYFEDQKAFALNRYRLLLSCLTIHCAVLDCSKMWSSYTIAPNRLAQELACVGRQFLARPLTLKLALIGEGDLFPSPAPGFASLNDTMAFFVANSSGCVSLELEVDSFIEEEALLRALWDAEYKSLRSLTFIWKSDHLAFVPIRYSSMELPFSGEELRSLTTLRLFDTHFCWHHVARFTGLTALVLHYTYSDLAPEACQLGAVLASNPLLIKVSLRLYIAPRRCFEPISPIYMSRLLELDVDFYGDCSVVDLAAALRMPALKRLAFAFADAVEMAAFWALVSYAPPVETMVLVGPVPCVQSAGDMLASVPSLVDLDVACANGHLFIQALHDASRYVTVCPRLGTLTVTGLKVQELRRAVEYRIGKSCPLQNLNCYRIHNCVYGSRSFPVYMEALTYLLDNLDIFNVRGLGVGEDQWMAWSLDWVFH
ncbi:hypothetical protein DFH06DRAFT_1334742 [Mycena polygramma]|nr:hypothetical protein DFH06DRAFT_1334742 [Mycena polygramma]